MNATELRKKYHEELKARLSELVAEQAQIEGVLHSGGIERRATAEDHSPRSKWTKKRRDAQSRRMKRLHRQGVFKR